MKKVLILYTSIGSGHLSAARALESALKNQYSDIDVRVVDVFNSSIQTSKIPEYLTLLSILAFPGVYDRAWRSGSMKGLYQLTSRIWFIRGKVMRVFRDYNPDITVCTHTLPCTILANMKERTSRLIAVPTDFVAHPYWPIRGVDAFLVASEYTKKGLEKRGVEPGIVISTGIPVHPEFGELFPIANLSGKQKILVLGGSRQVAPYAAMKPILRHLILYLKMHPTRNIEWEFIFGNNKTLHAFAQRHLGEGEKITLEGYVDNMPKRLAESSLVMTKPGGLILAESLALGKPVVFLTRGTGQEAANTEFVEATRTGWVLNQREKLIEFIQEFDNDPSCIEEVRKIVNQYRYPDSVRVAAEIIRDNCV